MKLYANIRFRESVLIGKVEVSFLKSDAAAISREGDYFAIMPLDGTPGREVHASNVRYAEPLPKAAPPYEVEYEPIHPVTGVTKRKAPAVKDNYLAS